MTTATTSSADLGVYDCGLDPCRLSEGTPVVDAGMDFIRCSKCQVLRIPESKLVHTYVEPDPVGSLSLVMRTLFRMRMLWLTNEFPSLKRKDIHILDMGCGDGQFLEYLVGRGYTRVVGIEPDADRAAHARLRKVPVFASIDEARAAGALGDKVDFVLAWHVLEHVPRPADFIKDCVDLLKSGGHMLISVPNQQSMQTRLFGRYSAFPDYGRHIWYHDAAYSKWIARMVPATKASLLRDRNYEYEIFSWVESILSSLTRNPTLVNRTLKKGSGGPTIKLAVAAASAALLPLATILAPLSIASRHGSTLTFVVTPEAQAAATAA